MQEESCVPGFIFELSGETFGVGFHHKSIARGGWQPRWCSRAGSVGFVPMYCRKPWGEFTLGLPLGVGAAHRVSGDPEDRSSRGTNSTLKETAERHV